MSIFFNRFYISLKIIFLFTLVTTSTYSQEKINLPDIEKIYIHTDRSNYAIGEDLWYKAYCVYAYNNQLFQLSNTLYVELISSDSKIIARNATLLKEGLGHGDFKLTRSDDLKPGIYQLRAYTNWQRNFGDDFVFKKEIEIVDVFASKERDKKSVNEPVIANEIITKNDVSLNAFKIDFFPEGGSLIEGVPSIIAFKATDNYGNPINASGSVFDSNDNLVSLLSTMHDGMGIFQIKPQKNMQYYAKIKDLNDSEFKIDLPIANKEGYALSARQNEGKHLISIKTNKETLNKHPNDNLTLICKSKGITYLEGPVPIDKQSITLELSKENIPEGIIQLTLYDGEKRPQSERLIYIEKGKDFNVGISTSKTVYKPSEEVIIDVSSKKNNGQALPANFSLSVIDSNIINNKSNLGTNICSYFLMESDIRGEINNPEHYFDIDNPKRLDDLDLLLLTQGWRDFLWKSIPKLEENPKFNIEKGITISGSVKQLLGNKPKENNTVTLALFNKGEPTLLFSPTDSEGRFMFENPMIIGNAVGLFSTQDEKGKNRGMLVLDSLSWPSPSLPVDFKISNQPIIKLDNTFRDEVFEKYVRYNVSPENVLDEVEIIGKKKEEIPSLYGEANHTFVIDEKTQHFNSVFQLIQYSVPGVMVTGNTISFVRYGNPAQIIIDGAVWGQEILAGIATDDIAKIEAFVGPSSVIFGPEGGNGVIVLYTKKGLIIKDKKKQFHSITKEIKGFYDARVFYSTDPQEPNFDFYNEHAFRTVRNTIYWSPYVIPNENGLAQEKFYNCEIETEAKVTLEGITASGIPIVKNVYYSIEK